MQWTRSRDGLGGVLRKVMTQQHQIFARGRGANELDHPAVQHMLLVEASGEGPLQRWFASHPTLVQRVHCIYGRDMAPLALAPMFTDQSS